MNVHERLTILREIYNLHQAHGADAEAVCVKGCATCCTCNVTATTLECLLIYDYLCARGVGVETWLDKLMASAPAARFQPKVTINQMAALCMRGEDLPEEVNDPSAGSCHLLNERMCSIYPVRPLGCRAMLSRADCSKAGEAQMPPFILSVNNVLMQYLEAIDQPGGTGNLVDLLRFMMDDASREAYLQDQRIDLTEGLLVNRPFPVLMVPPEHHQSIKALIQALNKAYNQTKQ